MKLNLQGIKNKEIWKEKGYQLPEYDIEAMRTATRENPYWIHFGAGNLFRAFHARMLQEVLNKGDVDRGVIVAEGYDYEIIDKMYTPHDNLGIVATLKSDGTIEKTIVASVAEALPLDSENETAYNRLKEIFCKDSLQMVTFSITEKGYSLVDGKGQLLPDVSADFVNGPKHPASYMGKVTSLLYARFASGQKPVAMVSTDNCSHNGDKLYSAVHTVAKGWLENDQVSEDFVKYLESDKVSFTWSMIDKITPRPDKAVEQILQKDGVEELDPVITSKHTYVAPFVNAEETEYLVIENDFPNGKPALEAGGVIFTQKELVDKVERMKVCTCLNPLHTGLAIFGCLLGYRKISEEMKDPDLKKMVELLGYKEGLPVVTDPGIIHPEEFLKTVLEVRLPNPFMPDTPQRIATDTSQKLAIRFGETVKEYRKDPKRRTSDLKIMPLVYAGWLRYLMGVDDKGEKFELSPDPMLEELCPYVAGLTLGETDREKITRAIHPILSNTSVFGFDMFETGLDEKVSGYFMEMLKGSGAVRETLKKYVTNGFFTGV